MSSEKVYHKKRGITYKLAIILTILNAVVIMWISIGNTSKFADMFGLPPTATTFLVEVAFALLLFLRARQRALGLNVPFILHLGYFGVFCLLTIVNMHGLSIHNSTYGPWAGLTVSGLMWLLENILVWLSTKSHEPYQKSIFRQEWDAIKEAWEAKIIQEIKWIKYNAQRPSLKLVKKVRREEKRRKKVIGDDLPGFFIQLQQEEPIEQIVVELKETEPVEVKVESETEEPEKETAAVVPLKKKNEGFLAEMNKRQKSPAPRFQPNEEARNEALEKAEMLMKALGRLPKVSEIKEKGVSEYYSKWARSELKKQRETE